MRFSRFSLWMFIMLVMLYLAASAYSGAQSAEILYVSATDSECGGQSPCFNTIQSAVDAASEGAEIRVTAGNYTGTFTREVHGIEYDQVVLITRAITIQGGYSESDWENPDPTLNPTIIDANAQGRGITALGDGSQRVEIVGITITGGDYSGLGNAEGESYMGCVRTGSDCAGGLLAHRVSIVLRNMIFENNRASSATDYSDGGGAYLWDVEAGSRIENVRFINNRAEAFGGAGGALVVTGGMGVEIVSSTFANNYAGGYGGAIYVFQPKNLVTVGNSEFTDNASSSEGGAIEARLTHDGQALDIVNSIFMRNETFLRGAAINVVKQGSGRSVTAFSNVLLAENTTSASGGEASVICLQGGSGGELALEAKHLTIANQPELAAFRVINDSGQNVEITAFNLLVATAATPFSLLAEGGGSNHINQRNSLFNNIEELANVTGEANRFDTQDVQTGNALLDENYHLMAGSAAIDSGIDAGVVDDIDGDARPHGAGFDIGADEYVGN